MTKKQKISPYAAAARLWHETYEAARAELGMSTRKAIDEATEALLNPDALPQAVKIEVQRDRVAIYWDEPLLGCAPQYRPHTGKPNSILGAILGLLGDPPKAA